jgi:hypothetical protein
MESKKRLGELLVEEDIISKENLESALRLQVGENRRLGYLLIKMGLITETQLHSVLTKQLDLPITDIEKTYSIEVKNTLPRYFCNMYNVFPLSFGEYNTLNLAMVDPSDSEALADIEYYTNKVVRAFLASQSDIKVAINKNLPWSVDDFLNDSTSGRLTAFLAVVAFVLATTVGYQVKVDRQLAKYGKVSHKEHTTLYENHDLIVGFTKNDKVTLLGHGAHSDGYYSIAFDDITALESFVEKKRENLSRKQYEWVQWVAKKQ